MRARPFLRGRLSLALVLLLQAASRFGHAQVAPGPDAGSASPLGLTWVSADPSCDGSAVATRAVELVNKGVTPRLTHARAQVSREGEQWVVDLQTRSESQIGRRTLRGESCKEIQQASALLLAMIMESEARAEVAASPALVPPAPVPLAPQPSFSEGAPELDEAPELDKASAPPRRSPSPGFGFALRMESTAALGLQPSLGLGAAGSIGAAYGPFELHIGGSYWPTSRMAILARDGFLEMNRKVLGAAACYRLWDNSAFQALPCVGPELIWLKWQSTGLKETRHGDANHLHCLTASLELRLQVAGPLFLTITPGLTWEQPRPFEAAPCDDCASTQVFQTWAVGPRLGAGVGARF